MEKEKKRSSEVNDESDAKAKRVATLEDRMSSIEASVKCLVCLNIPRDVPVPCCGSGHIICQACRWKTSSCPKCKQKMDGNSLLAESLIGQLEHRCKFKAQGCQVKILLEDLKTHESNCPDNPDEKVIKIKFKRFKGKNYHEVFLGAKAITPMRELKKSYSKAVGMPVTNLRFMFLNLRINDDETPKILNLMEGDIIQVFHKAYGFSTDEAMYDIVDKITASDANRDFPMLKIKDNSDHPVSISCCPQGHIVIQVYWRPRLTSCSNCGKELFFNLQPGTILENVLHKCKFSYNGCAVKMRPKYLEVHEAECIHRGRFSADKEMIKIQFVDQAANEIHYRVKMTAKINELKKLYSFQTGFPGPQDLRCLFDGDKILEYKDETPTSLKMETGDFVEVYMASSAS